MEKEKSLTEIADECRKEFIKETGGFPSLLAECANKLLTKGTDVYWVELEDGMFTVNSGVVVETNELEVRLRDVNKTPGYSRTIKHGQVLRFKTGVLGYFDIYPFYEAPKQANCSRRWAEHTCPVCGVVE